MKNVIITGASGMIGKLILENCLQHPEVNRITSIARKPSGITHPKLTEVLHDDFLNFNPIADYFKDQQVCFFCIGVYTGAVGREEFRKITVDYTKTFADMLRKQNAETRFCFLSGAGADQSEKSKLMFAQDKGIAENYLIGLQFTGLHIFRPAYIYPVAKRKEPNLLYKVMRVLYKPFLSKIYPNGGITSVDLAKVMTETGLKGNAKIIFENKDIRKAAAAL